MNNKPGTPQRAAKWNSSDDAKLADLIRRGKCDPARRDTPTLKELHKKNWEHKNYTTWSRLIRKKLKEFEADRIIGGARGKLSAYSFLLATAQPYQSFHPVPASNNENPQDNGASETDREDTDGETLGDEDTDNYDSDMSATPKKPTKTYAAAAAGAKTPPRSTKKVNFEEDDLADRMSSVKLNDDDFSLEVKDPWKRSRHLVTRTDLQFFEARVDILLLAAILPSQLKLALSDCGMYLIYNRCLPSWFASHKHHEKEWLTENPGQPFDPTSAENAGLFAVAQKMRKAYPDMDEGEKTLPTPDQLIPLPFKCKGVPYDVQLRHYPCPIKIVWARPGYRPVEYTGFHFKLTVKLMGAQDILYRKNATHTGGCGMDDFNDLYD